MSLQMTMKITHILMILKLRFFSKMIGKTKKYKHKTIRARMNKIINKNKNYLAHIMQLI